ncbi:MAG: leucyl aminopeptidase [Chloroflexi bacterium]|nr:leucyl aminopeptidase [Chloroflexota bacterium]
MDIRAVAGRLESYAADAVIVNLFENVTEPGSATAVMDQALNGSIRDLITDGDFTGKAGQVSVLYPRGAVPARRVILAGLGAPEKLTVDAVRRAAASAILKARELKAAHVASVLHGTGAGGLAIEESARAITEGSLMALYDYRGQKSSEKPEAFPKQLDLLILDDKDTRAAEGIQQGMAVAAGVAVARDLANLPPNICTPDYMAQVATELAQTAGLKVEVLERRQIEALKMGALLGVAQGSDTPPRFIILEHNAGRDDLDTVVLVGKGVTFDTGGYSIKTAEGMVSMKGDMSGGAAVIGALGVVAGLKLPLRVVGLIPAADNMISGHAYRPQDVLTASNGVTIEVISTDAEGRLLLADALVYASRYQPSAVVDIATLTGACVVALGEGVAAGLFSTDDRLRDTLLAAADFTAERLWPMPLFPEYEKAIESQTADLKNTGGRTGGVGTSATFLKHFVDYPAWAHIDMAGMMTTMGDVPYVPKGATGYGVRLLAEFLQRWAGREKA